MKNDVSLLVDLRNQLDNLKQQQLWRRRFNVDTACAPEIEVDGRKLMAFCSNDYLGLAADPQIINALSEGVSLYGAGSGASHLISGHSRAHDKLETALAEFFSTYFPCGRALYLSSGYMANLAVITALADRSTEIFSEALNHASLIDAVRLSRAKITVYPHTDLGALSVMLEASTAERKLVVTDGVFSMDGDIAPLNDLLRLCERHDAWLIVDDAHGFGVLGQQGRGIIEHFSVRSERLILIGTLSKAAGIAGAFIAGHETIIEWLVQRARPYIYSTASPPALAHALLTSLEIIAGDEGARRRAALHQRIVQWKSALHLKHWQLLESVTPIQPVVIGDNAHTMSAAHRLREHGFWVGSVRPPTVPVGTARLRVTLSSSHTEAQVEQLAMHMNSLEDASS
jgi:8-amino-7-oxononanoate synthase